MVRCMHLIVALALCLALCVEAQAALKRPRPVNGRAIAITTAHTALNLWVGPDKKVYQTHYGAPAPAAQKDRPDPERELHPGAGDGYIFEPALRADHADGNTSLDLLFSGVETSKIDDNVTLTRIELKDPAYPFFVTINFKAYQAEDVIEQWSEIRHQEAGPVTLHQFASASQSLEPGDWFLTGFHGDHMNEMNLATERLTPGVKILDSKLGVRAHYYMNPSFLLSKGGAAKENEGEVIGGQLAWSGSFQLAFEPLPFGFLRVQAGMNPYSSDYSLKAGETFATPPLMLSWSGEGKGPLSRNFQRWGRRYALRDGDKDRAVLLNNWEATYFDFDEPKLVALFDGAKEEGLELFLLDDGWFGNKYPRNNDKAGLGDWAVNAKKLPHGVSYLADEAKKRGLRFGIWIEPEMVNPKSELFEQHPDWAIQQPKREPKMHRNQMVLDLSNPAVREYVFKCVDDLLSQNPGVSYVKWDCNSFLYQPGSPYLKAGEQGRLWIDYVRALYDVMDRVAKKHPAVELMLCSGGGGRVDYGALRYFHEFWASDNTDPLSRVRIQYGYSHFFPSIATACHVTRMGKRPLKFAFDVAMSGRMGMDVDLGKFSPEERKFTASAIATYKGIREVVLKGELFRLESPYDGDRTSLVYVTPDRSRAVLFVYQTKDAAGAEVAPVKLQGLDPAKRYTVRELNLAEGSKSQLAAAGQAVEGSKLMEAGLAPACRKQCESHVIELTAER